jgi:hypothetical protein
METGRRYKSSTLYLVRLWAKGVDATGDGSVEWHGRVQRVMDGESHEFKSLQDLVDLLSVMVSNSERR